MKKAILFVIFILLLGLLTVLSLRLITAEDNWICVNGQWIKHGNPSASKPTTECSIFGANYWSCKDGVWQKFGNPTEPRPSSPCERATTTPGLKDKIVVDSPSPNTVITSPLVVTGKARGNWYFEASFPVKLLDSSGKIIAQTAAQAQGDWMTEDFVPFRAQVEFKAGELASGTLVLERDNPSGLPQNAEQINIPVLLASQKKTSVRVYFGNTKLNPGAEDCTKVYPIVRMVVPTEAIGRAALEELLKGPSDEEKAQGFFTSLNSGVAINKLNINNGIAVVDFSPKLEEAVGGSCRVAAIRSQISTTLKQFSAVKEVVISINDRTEDILQP